MAASDPVLCTLCEQCSLSEQAVVWCSQCQEALCVGCQRPHDLSRSTKSHQTIPIADYTTLPPVVVDIKHSCDKHRQHYDMFCSIHNVAFCRKCLTEYHKECKGIMPLEEVVGNARHSSTIFDIEQSLQFLQEYVTELIKNRTENKSDLYEQEQDLREKVKNFRQRLNGHLDRLELKLLEELSTESNLHNKKIENALVQLIDKSMKINDLKHDVAKMKTFASDLQVFLGMKEIETTVEDEKLKIELIGKEECKCRINLGLHFESQIESIVDNLTILGSVSVSVTPTDIKLKSIKQIQAQIDTGASRRIDDIRLSKLQSFHIMTHKSKIDISACLIGCAGKLILADGGRGNRLIVLQPDGSILCYIAVSPAIYDIACVDDRKVVCTIGFFNYKSGVIIADIQTQEVKHIRQGVNSFRGIANSKGKLIYSVNCENLEVYNTANGDIRHIPTTRTKINRIALFKEKLYLSEKESAAIHCLDMTGNEIWKRKYFILKTILDLTVDKDGYVYVVGEGSNNVIITSPDGRKHREVTFEEDGPIQPRAINCDQETNKVLVCNKEGAVWLYDVI